MKKGEVEGRAQHTVHVAKGGGIQRVGKRHNEIHSALVKFALCRVIVRVITQRAVHAQSVTKTYCGKVVNAYIPDMSCAMVQWSVTKPSST